MNQRTIEVIVMPDGSLVIDAIGFKGPACEKATRFLEEALGQIAAKQRKPAYNERNRTQTKQRVGQ
jgi:hypothetical protein